MPIFGADFSHFDWERGPMDLAAIKSAGISFVTHKVSEGNSFADPRFAEFAKRAKVAAMPLIGGYCVNLRGDQKPQVDWFLKQLDGKAPWWRDGDFMVQLDCERWSNRDGVYAYEPRLSEIEAWCDYFVQRTGGRCRPIVYAPKWAYGDTLKGLPYLLWASGYGSNPSVGYRSAYPGDTSSRWAAYSGQTPAVLQYGSKTIIGTQPTSDANAFRGTLDQLRALTQGDDVTPAEVKSAVWYSNLKQADPNAPSAGTVLLTMAEQMPEVLAKLDALAARPVADVDEAALAAALAPLLDAGATPAEVAAAVRAELDKTRLTGA